MNTRTKILGAGAVILAIAVPAAFAASGNTSFSGFGKQGGMQGHFSQSGATMSGVTLPSQAEMEAHRATMEKVQEAMKNLSDADKATLKSMRDTAAKSERDFLRSKGVPLPTEDDIAAWEAKMPNKWDGLGMGMGRWMEMGGMMGGKNGKRGHKQNNTNSGTTTVSQ